MPRGEKAGDIEARQEAESAIDPIGEQKPKQGGYEGFARQDAQLMGAGKEEERHQKQHGGKDDAANAEKEKGMEHPALRLKTAVTLERHETGQEETGGGKPMPGGGMERRDG